MESSTKNFNHSHKRSFAHDSPSSSFDENPKTISLFVKHFGVPLLSSAQNAAVSPCDFLHLHADHPYSIGRRPRDCNFVFRDRRVSKRHCQLLFDSSLRKLYILNGVLLNDDSTATWRIVHEFRRRARTSSHGNNYGFELREASNGLFVNGVEMEKGTAVELSVGDRVSLVCGNQNGSCGVGNGVGFVVEGIDFEGCDGEIDGLKTFSEHSQSGKRNKRVFALKDNVSRYEGVVGRGRFLLDRCRDILLSNDPVSCVVRDGSLCAPCNAEEQSSLGLFGESKRMALDANIGFDVTDKVPITKMVLDSAGKENHDPSSVGGDSHGKLGSGSDNVYPQPGKNFYLNRLEFMNHGSSACHRSISLPELIHPLENISRIFIATFTSDIKWFLTYCKIPSHLPVTIACQNTERCWSSKPEERVSVPYQDYPNLVAVYPQFPETIAFGNDRKRKGIACHHPKLIVLQRKDSIRIVITSANLVEKQFLGSVVASVVGLSHFFRTVADSNSARLKALASFLGKSCKNAHGKLEIVLRRKPIVSVDENAVIVLVSNPDRAFEGDCVQLGFLPRHVAKWVSPLWDAGFLKFSGYVCPKEARAAAIGENSKKVQLILNVSEGHHFKDMSKMIHSEHIVAFCSLIASIERCYGLWRLQEVLNRYKWPESLKSEIIYSASSIGSSINSKFLAAFSSAVGKKSLQHFDSEESDPEWGCWNAGEELKNPSVRILFPTIERVKNAYNGILPSRYILCFTEKTWQRLKPLDILHDAVPHPHERIGHPMHVKVVRRCFWSGRDAPSVGWIYCGSHNFSAAAWGRQISNPFRIKADGPKKEDPSVNCGLHICNYELGIIFTFPPTENNGRPKVKSTELDDIILPFVVPAPKYGSSDRPATKQAMREVMFELAERESEKRTEEEMIEELDDEEEFVELPEELEAANYVEQEKEEEKEYADILWSQVDSSQSS
ncbi:uncharacterized protein [Phaseolus vulgaris]|uniref:uncharacterized protein isoform X2 n=1 Tax=Phaseolus vulgaris TaxID=3885 RepID=UPI0035CBFB2F